MVAVFPTDQTFQTMNLRFKERPLETRSITRVTVCGCHRPHRAATGETVRRPIRHLFLFIGTSGCPDRAWRSTPRLRADRSGSRGKQALSGNEPSRSLFHRRHPFGVDQARRRRGWRRRASRRSPARLSVAAARCSENASRRAGRFNEAAFAVAATLAVMPPQPSGFHSLE